MRQINNMAYLRFFLFIFFSVSIFMRPLSAQNLQKLPDDPRVKRGVLDDGLSYIIIKNGSQRGYVNFCMAQKTGYSLEEEGQHGMSKMIEALSLRGTRNFADSTIINYLSSIGVVGNDIQFETGADQIKYYIKNVPVKSSAIDSSLLILYNWLSSINLDEEDVTSEMPYLKNRISDEWSDAERRLNYRLLKQLFPRSPYVACQSPQDATAFKSFNSKDLRSFYYKWYRPDLQAVIVVGDIDPAAIETKIKSVFATIPKQMKVKHRGYYDPELPKEPIVYLLQDKEYNKTKITIDLLDKSLPNSYRQTSVPFVEEFMKESISRLLGDRLRASVIEKNLPIYNIKISEGYFMGIGAVNSYSVSYETLPDASYSTIAFISSEIKNIASIGFSDQEFSVVKEMYLRKLESLYLNRSNLPNTIFLQRALAFFFDGYSLASIELKYEFMKDAIAGMTLSQLNGYASAILGNRKSSVISCKYPAIKGVEQISKERLLSAYNEFYEVEAASSKVKIEEVSWPQFVQQQRPASIISETDDLSTNSKHIVLSNGATIILKNNYASKDTVSIKAVGRGGFSITRYNNREMENFVNGMLNIGGLGNISKANMSRLFSYYNMDYNVRINANTQEINGFSDISNIEKLFQGINMAFVSPSADERAFDNYKKGKIFSKIYLNLASDEAFRDSIDYYNNSNKAYITPISIDEIKRMEYTPLFTSCKKLFSNAADFVFIVIGNISSMESRIKELAVQYIGTIPGNLAGKEDWRIMPHYYAKGNVEKRFLFNMEIPKTRVSITLSLGTGYTIENKVICDLLNQYLNTILSSGPIKKMASQIRLKSELNYYPEDIALFNINFVSDNTGEAFITKTVEKELRNVASDKMSEADFASLVSATAAAYHSKSKYNTYWLNVIVDKNLTGTDLNYDYIGTLNGITKEKFSTFVRDLLDKGNNISVIMEGTTEDISSKNLLRGNKFIKDFFEL